MGRVSPSERVSRLEPTASRDIVLGQSADSGPTQLSVHILALGRALSVRRSDPPCSWLVRLDVRLERAGHHRYCFGRSPWTNFSASYPIWRRGSDLLLLIVS